MMPARNFAPIGRRRLLIGVGTLLSVGLTKRSVLDAATSVAAEPNPPLTSYFVAESGNDSADGLTPSTAWKTLQKADANLSENSILHLRSGDIFYGELHLPANCEISTYGAGARPVLTKFKILDKSAAWSEHSSGVWKIDLASPETHSGFTAGTDANIGYLLVDGTVYPHKKRSLAEVRAPWDFWCDTADGILHVAAKKSPAELAANIRAAPRGESTAIITCDNGGNVIHDVHLLGTGGHGISGSGADVHIHDCSLEYIGGSYLPGFRDGSVRYGNAIENWNGARRWLIEQNQISQIYDAAYTAQGYPDADSRNGGWDDIVIRSNHIHDCGQSFEFWTRGTNGEMRRILVEGNHCERAGYSALSDARPNQDVRVHILTYDWDLPGDITIQGNMFDLAYSAYSYHEIDPAGLISRNNQIRLLHGTLMQMQRPETIEQAEAWSTATGYEVGSNFTTPTVRR